MDKLREESRKQFEEWFRSKHEGQMITKGRGYSDPLTQLMWQAWQASRASIVVDIESHTEFEIEHMISPVQHWLDRWTKLRRQTGTFYRTINQRGVTAMHDIAGNKLKVGDEVIYLVSKDKGDVMTGVIEDIYQIQVGYYKTYVAEVDGAVVTAAGIGRLNDWRVRNNYQEFLKKR